MRRLQKIAVKKLPLDSFHRSFNPRMGLFAGWEVPLFYRSIREEYFALCNRGGIFDISHLGKFLISGKDTVSFLELTTSSAWKGVARGRGKVTFFLNPRGGIIDMPFLSRDGEEEWLLTTNAEVRSQIFDWLQTQVQVGGFSVVVRDLTPEYFLLSIQGPHTLEVVSQFFNYSFLALSRFEGTWVKYNSLKVRVSRMAFSWADGLELLFSREGGADFFLKLHSFLIDQEFSWCGFGVRDLLRFEAGFPLYGREMDETVTPLELGKESLISWKKENFIGKPPLVLEKKRGSKKKLTGMEVEGRGIPRWGYPIYDTAGLPCGYVTSGNYSFALKKNLAMGFINNFGNKLGEELCIIASKKKLRARIVPLPFLS